MGHPAISGQPGWLHIVSSEQDILGGVLDISKNIAKVPEEKFKIFLKACLKMQPKKRKTATELLRNIFLTN